jgi:hypothetical protein
VKGNLVVNRSKRILHKPDDGRKILHRENLKEKSRTKKTRRLKTLQ